MPINYLTVTIGIMVPYYGISSKNLILCDRYTAPGKELPINPENKKVSIVFEAIFTVGDPNK